MVNTCNIKVLTLRIGYFVVLGIFASDLCPKTIICDYDYFNYNGQKGEHNIR